MYEGIDIKPEQLQKLCNTVGKCSYAYGNNKEHYTGTGEEENWIIIMPYNVKNDEMLGLKLYIFEKEEDIPRNWFMLNESEHIKFTLRNIIECKLKWLSEYNSLSYYLEDKNGKWIDVTFI